MSIALALGVAAKFIPDIIARVTKDEDKIEIAKRVLGAAKAATGHKDADNALAAYHPTPEQVDALRKDVLSVIKLEVDDIKHAREMHKDDDVTNHLSYTVMYLNPLYILLGIGALIYVTTLNLEAGLLATISAMIGGAVNQFYQERQQVMNYRFGSSLGSKLKDMLKK